MSILPTAPKALLELFRF